ncbi:MAG: hypothetical protein GY754_37055 [bacterium]|nr:hypothetical protein [bacterium]
MEEKIYRYEDVIEEMGKDVPEFVDEERIYVYVDSLPFRMFSDEKYLIYNIIKDNAIDYFLKDDITINENEYAVVLDTIELEDIQVEKEINCNGWIFSDFFLSNATFQKNINFAGSQFSGEASFYGSQFFGEADFSMSQFSGVASFVQSQFSGETSFILSQFSGKVSFILSQFSGKASFIQSQFFGEADFTESQFSGKVSFYDSDFEQKANFTEIKIDKTIKFDNNKFKGPALFTQATINGLASFSQVEFAEETNFDYMTINNKIEFRDITCTANAWLDFSNNTFSGKIYLINSNLSKYSFLSSDMSCFEFINAAWADKKILYDEIQSKDIKKIEELYRQLKDKYLSKKNFQLADAFHYNELRTKQKQQTQYIPSWEKLYKLTSNYGMSWFRPLFCAAAVFFIFTGITFLYNGIIELDNPLKKAFEYNFYDTLLVKQPELKDNLGYFILVLKLKTALMAALIVQSGFAVRRKFKT